MEIDLPEADKICACGTTKTRIGEAVSEKLDYVPASVRVIETVRPKYACPHCHDGVVTAPQPPQAVDDRSPRTACSRMSSLPESLDHLPLYRLERIFHREHLDLAGHAVRLGRGRRDRARPDWRRVVPAGDGRGLYQDRRYAGDDSEETGSRKGRMWTYLDPLAPQVVFDATPTHERDGPEAFLARFAGHLQADAYTGSTRCTAPVGSEMGCWALPTRLRRGAALGCARPDDRADPAVVSGRTRRRQDRRDPWCAPAGTECADPGRDPGGARHVGPRRAPKSPAR